jgi:CubicO group peptidase (beta-lactamase class C family)
MAKNEAFNWKQPVLLFCMIWFCFGIVQLSSGDRPVQTLEQRIDHYLAGLPSHKSFSGTIYVSSGDNILINKGYGLADRSYSIKNRPDTKFLIGSITKAFTAVLIMQLVQEGKLDLEGNLKHYIPDLHLQGADRITVGQLLNHTSGIPHHYIGVKDFLEKHDNYFYSRADLIELISNIKPLHDPGEKNTYSSFNYTLLGIIIERITGKSFAEVLFQRIFAPLGMNNSGVENNRTIKPDMARGHARGLNGLMKAHHGDMSTRFASGDIYATASDLSHFLKALDPESDQLLPGKIKKVMIEKNYGFYTLKRQLPNGEEISVMIFGGSAYGFTAMAHRVPEKSWNLIALCNIQTPWVVGEIVDKLGDFLVEETIGQKAKLPEKTASPQQSTRIVEIRNLNKFRGWYKDPEGSIFGMVKKKNRLYRLRLQPFEISILELEPESPGIFRLARYPNIKYRYIKKPGTSDYHIEIVSGNSITKLNKINTGNSKGITEEFCGRFISRELQKSYCFYVRNNRLSCDDFLDYGGVDFSYLGRDRFGFQDGFLIFQRDEDGKILGFRLKRQDLDGFFGSRFVKN